MGLNTNITRKIFQVKYPYAMPYQSYLDMLKRGFELLAQNNIETNTELHDLKAIRLALEYRFEVMKQVRNRQIRHSLGAICSLAEVA